MRRHLSLELCGHQWRFSLQLNMFCLLDLTNRLIVVFVLFLASIMVVQINSVIKVPLVINIPSCGCNHGSKESKAGFRYFFENGFAVANVEYHLVHKVEAPAAVQNIKCTLNYL